MDNTEMDGSSMEKKNKRDFVTTATGLYIS